MKKRSQELTLPGKIVELQDLLALKKITLHAQAEFVSEVTQVFATLHTLVTKLQKKPEQLLTQNIVIPNFDQKINGFLLHTYTTDAPFSNAHYLILNQKGQLVHIAVQTNNYTNALTTYNYDMHIWNTSSQGFTLGERKHNYGLAGTPDTDAGKTILHFVSEGLSIQKLTKIRKKIR